MSRRTWEAMAGRSCEAIEQEIKWDKAIPYERDFRGLWIQRINAAVREHGMTYSRFIAGLKAAGIELDRKVLSAIAYDDAPAFAEIVKKAQAAADKATEKPAIPPAAKA